MGCDIHLHIEVKIKGLWHHWSRTYPPRNYTMFALMANVRNSDGIEPLMMPRGLPENVTFLTKYASDYRGVDGHSHSWLGVDEIQKLEDWWKENSERSGDFEMSWLNTYLFGSTFSAFKKYPADNDAGVEDVRFVFWFDN